MDLRGIERLERLVRGLRLYVVSHADLELEVIHEDVIETATLGGATAIELSVPRARTTDLVRRGTSLRALAEARGVLFFVLNDVDAAAGLRADGVFLDRADMSLREARKMLGKESHLGVPVQTVQQALRAEAQGADFVRVVPRVDTRAADGYVSDVADLGLIASSLSVPVTAWEPENGDVERVLSSGIAGISAGDRMLHADDLESYCLRLRAAVERALVSPLERRVRPARPVTWGL